MFNRAPLVPRALRVALGSFAALALVLGTAAGAQAAVTQSSITSPPDPFFGFDQGQTQSVTISGTSNGNSADTVDILCYVDDGTSGNAQSTVAPNVPVGNDGTFTTSVPIADLVFSTQEFTSGYCRLRAVPGGTTPISGLNSFAGPRVLVGHLQESMNVAGLDDYYAVDPQLTASDDFNSFGDFGIADSYLFDPNVTGQLDSTGFFGNDFPEVEAASDGSQAGVEVDGHPAYPPDLTGDINSGATGIQPLTLNSITQNTSNGDLTIVETDPLEFCSGNPFPPSSGNCTSFVPSGVELQRTMTQTDDGHIVYIEDAYSSTDGASHTVKLLLENDQYFSATGSFGATPNISYEFPGESAFAPHAGGDHVSATASAPGSILIESNAEPDGSTAGARGAITYGQAPSGPFAFSTASFPPAVGDVAFDAANTITVPATGSVPIRYAYSTEFTLAAVQRDALTAEDHFQAAMVSFSSPSNGATVSSSPVMVTGSASAGSGVSSVTVDGVKTTVSGGSFSASVPVKTGVNTLTAVVTSNGGASASASENVNFAVAPNATTGSASAVKATSAALSGSVTPGTAGTSYQFRYGTTTAYGKSSTAGSLGASSSSSAVSASISGLSPNKTYHFQLVASSSAGKGAGKDVTFHTPRAAPRRVSGSVKPHADLKAPFKYRYSGSIVRPAGVAASGACRGTVSVTVKHSTHKLISRRAKVKGKCKFSGKVTFTGKKLHGKGKLSFSFHFGGNAVLTAKNGKSVTARFG